MAKARGSNGTFQSSPVFLAGLGQQGPSRPSQLWGRQALPAKAPPPWHLTEGERAVLRILDAEARGVAADPEDALVALPLPPRQPPPMLPVSKAVYPPTWGRRLRHGSLRPPVQTSAPDGALAAANHPAEMQDLSSRAHAALRELEGVLESASQAEAAYRHVASSPAYTGPFQPHRAYSASPPPLSSMANWAAAAATVKAAPRIAPSPAWATTPRLPKTGVSAAADSGAVGSGVRRTWQRHPVNQARRGSTDAAAASAGVKGPQRALLGALSQPSPAKGPLQPYVPIGSPAFARMSGHGGGSGGGAVPWGGRGLQPRAQWKGAEADGGVRGEAQRRMAEEAFDDGDDGWTSGAAAPSTASQARRDTAATMVAMGAGAADEDVPDFSFSAPPRVDFADDDADDANEGISPAPFPTSYGFALPSRVGKRGRTELEAAGNRRGKFEAAAAAAAATEEEEIDEEEGAATGPVPSRFVFSSPSAARKRQWK
ncbi:unnamed protein product [Phaeothamnion confervicola]